MHFHILRRIIIIVRRFPFPGSIVQRPFVFIESVFVFYNIRRRKLELLTPIAAVSFRGTASRLDEYKWSLNIDPESPRRQGYLIQILHRAQALFGCLPEPLQMHILAQPGHSPRRRFPGHKLLQFLLCLSQGTLQIQRLYGNRLLRQGRREAAGGIPNYLKIGLGQVTEDGCTSLDALRCIGPADWRRWCW